MNATEDGHPLGESPAVDGCTVCRTEPARAVEGHRVCVSHEGIATELADLKRRVGEAESSDPLDAIRRLSGLGMLQGADKLAATEQLAERQAQALNAVRELHRLRTGRAVGFGDMPDEDFCAECSTVGQHIPYPCPTIRVLDEAGA